MKKVFWAAGVVALLGMSGLWHGKASAQGELPLPAPAPGSSDLHIFYGQVPAQEPQSPVIVFIHGLRGRAADWWENNDMYGFVYRAGYRSAFVSLNHDNTPNDKPIVENADVIEDALPKIAARYGVEQVFVVAHSKGGLDLQEALARERVSGLVRVVFTISSPNTGTELADWAYGPGRSVAEALGLLTPGVADLRTTVVAGLRRRADPVLTRLQIPFYTMWGTTSAGNPLTRITGLILSNLTEQGINNDGLVAESRTRLPRNYAIDVGGVPDNHFLTDSGNRVFPRINAYLQSYRLDNPAFKKVVSNGFGDPANTWFWSQAWFKGKLYVGTAQSQHCLTFATAAIRLEGPLKRIAYPPPGGDFMCTPDMRDLPLSGEIWQYTPETRAWVRVFKSPNVVPVKFNTQGQPTGFTALDVGFRDMIVYKEEDGTEALYVAGIGASSTFDVLPFYSTRTYPAPRILRSVDGLTFAPLPAQPGTFLGDIVQNSPQDLRVRGFRSFAALKGKLFVTASDYRGVGLIIASQNPKAGNNAWAYAGPTAAEMPVWTLETFNGHLYAVTGDRRTETGYEVHKTLADGPPPYFFQRVVTSAAGQSHQELKALNALSVGVFQGRLYVGTDRQTEMIRVNPDDTWDLVAGFPRNTPDGYKAPISGLNQWLGNYFNGHFWRMVNWNERLYVGTWDWSVLLKRLLVLDTLFSGQYGTDVYSTDDGVHWGFETRQGFGHPDNFGTRSWAVTPYGLFVGTAKPVGGADLYVNQSTLDFDGDNDIDQDDAARLLQDAAGDPPANGPDDPRDLDRDGLITANDVARLRTQCTKSDCAVIAPSQPTVPAPTRLTAASAFVVGRNAVSLTWDPVQGAVRYIVFRSENRPLMSLFPEDFSITLPGIGVVNIPDDFRSGRFDLLCENPDAGGLICLLNQIFRNADETTSWLGLPLSYIPIKATAATSYGEAPPTNLQSLYFVVAVDAQGRRSRPSNFVGGPSYALPETVSTVRLALQRMVGQGADAGLVAAAQARVAGVSATLEGSGARRSRQAILEEVERLDAWMRAHPSRKAAAVDVRRLLVDVADTLRFVETGQYPATVATRDARALTDVLRPPAVAAQPVATN